MLHCEANHEANHNNNNSLLNHFCTGIIMFIYMYLVQLYKHPVLILFVIGTSR